MSNPFELAESIFAYLFIDPSFTADLDRIGVTPEHMPSEASRSLLVEFSKGTATSAIPKVLGATWTELGGLKWMTGLLDKDVTFVEAYFSAQELVKHRSVTRSKKFFLESVQRLDAGEPVNAVLEDTDRFLATTTGEASTIPKKLDSLLHSWHEARNAKRRAIPFSCGISEVETAIGPLYGGELVVIGARPACGKTSFLTQLLVESAKAGSASLFFSGEMTADELIDRMIAQDQESNLTASNMRERKFESSQDISDLVDSSERLSNLPIFIDELRGRNSEQLIGSIRRHCRHAKTKIVAIDYLGLIGSKKHAKSRYEEISETSRLLKAVAVETKTIIVVLVQLNRAAAHDMRGPDLSHFRDSGQIEQDADLAILLSRVDGQENVTKFDLAKHRHGIPKQIPLKFHGRKCRFEGLSNVTSEEFFSEIEKQGNYEFF
jgi:replicative DNA helicase